MIGTKFHINLHLELIENTGIGREPSLDLVRYVVRQNVARQLQHWILPGFVGMEQLCFLRSNVR